jgi:hypothetical protein
MKAIARLLITATTLAVLGTLGTAAGATPLADDPKPASPAPAASHGQGTRCDAGPGPQVDCTDRSAPAADAPVPVASPAPPAGRAVPVLALFGLLAGTLLTAAAWLRRHRRPRAAA